MSTSLLNQVMSCAAAGLPALRQLLQPYALKVVMIADQATLPGSFWGDPEAGLIGDRLFIRPQTPLQSALHEACHYICMDPRRRARLHTDAGGGYDEENAVCYLQVLLAEQLPHVGRERMWADMDSWGYSFRLGSARRWFEDDAGEVRQWLEQQNLIDARQQPTGQLRQSA
ncbi:hypothetical protein [Thiohalophilus sp.]|uniref:hypothetical protein n=1 Tax=Thiohalophilus sp. TaxID=3028392 RepID=UPI0039769D45